MSQNLDELFERARQAARAGQKETARRLLAQVLREQPRSEQAWLWLSAVLEKPAERVAALRQVLAINPRNELARKGLRALGAEEPPAGRQAAPGEAAEGPRYMPPDPEPEPGEPPAPGGVPLVSEAAVRHAQREVGAVLDAIQEEDEAGRLDVTWSASGRGMRPGLLPPRLRPTPMMLAIAGGAVIVVLVVVLVSAVMSNLRARQAANVTADLALTPILTPAPSATPRPTRTPTPASVSLPPEPTLDPGNAPRGDLRFGLTATPAYPLTPHPVEPALGEAFAAYGAGDTGQALERLAAVEGTLPPDAIYIRALALLAQGEVEAADEAVEMGITQVDDYAPLYAARALVLLRQDAIAQAEQAARQAVQIDPRLTAGHIALAEVYLARRDYAAAIAAIEAGREQRPHDVNLLVEGSHIYLAMGDAANAAAYAHLATYIDPGAQAAALALGRARLALGDTGRAIIGLEDYVYEVGPASAAAWGLLGRAYAEAGRGAEAEAAFARADQFNPGEAEALAGQGVLRLARGDAAGAAEDLRAALAGFDAPPADLRIAFAEAALSAGQPDEALIQLEAVRGNGTAPPEVEILALRALVDAGRYQEAVGAAEGLLAGAQSQTPVTESPEEGEGQTPEPTQTAVATPALTPEQIADVQAARAQALYGLGDLPAAQAAAEAALNIEETGTAHYVHALILADLGETPAAIRELQWVLTWNEVFGYPFAEEAATRLAELERLPPPEPEGA